MKIKLGMDWSNAIQIKQMTAEDIQSLFEKLNNGIRAKNLYSVHEWYCEERLGKLIFFIRETKNKKFMSIYLIDENRNKYIYTTHEFDISKNFREGKEGRQAKSIVALDFLKSTGKTLRKAFGYSDEEVKRCIPKAFQYLNPKYKEKIVEDVCYDDISSCYPSKICGRLPDWRKRKEIQGIAEPTEEYPFAFYVKGGFLAEFGVFDTRDWLLTDLAPKLLRIGKKEDWPINVIKPEEEITVLCPASDYELTEIYQKHYENKAKFEEGTEEYQKAKLVLNSSIGYMHLSKYDEFKLAHIAAVVIARSNNLLYNTYKELGRNNVVHLVVDGIIHKGKPLGSKVKSLGKYHIEFENAKFIMKGSSQWIAQLPDGKFVFKHSAFNATTDGTDINDVKDLNDIFKWCKIQTPRERLKALERKKNNG